MSKNIYFCVSAENDGTTSVYKRKWPPLCFLNCVSILKEYGYSGELIDEGDLENIPNGSVLILSSGSIDRWLAPSIRLNGLYKVCQKYSNRHEIYVTGLHATLFPKFILNKTLVKGVLSGMPEQSVLNFCKTGQWVKTSLKPDSSDLPIKSWPKPAFDQISASQYKFEPMGWDNFGVFEFGRGCEQNCFFCAKDAYYGNGSSHKSASNMVDELVYANKEHGFQSGYFMDLCFLNNRPLVEEFCKIFKKKRGSFVWACETKIDDLDENIIDLMYDAGCRMIGFGVCSFFDFKDRVMFDTKKYIEKILMMEQKGIRTLGYFIASPFFANITPYDRAVFQTMHKMPLTFANVRRYLDLKTPSWIFDEIQKTDVYRPDMLDGAIKKNMIKFYFNSVRVNRILRQIGLLKVFQSLKFFVNFLMRR